MSVELPGRSSVPTVAAFVADDVANASLSVFISNTPMNPRCSMQPHVSLHRNEVDGLIPITYSL